MHDKNRTTETWPEITGPGTPSIAYFKPGSLYNHPAALNNLKRIGGRPAGIHIQEVNHQPDASVIAYLKAQINL